MNAGRLQLTAVLAGVSAILIGFVPGLEAKTPAPSFAVATESPAATREASRVLSAGGNAIDAAVVAALVAGFTSPSSSGMGGGGFALVYSARDRKPFVLDFRETAPAAVDATVLDQRPVPPEKRGQTVGVPGEIAGLFELQGRFGRLGWRELAARAARLAAQGFATEPHASGQIAIEAHGLLARSATFRSAYLPDDAPAPIGRRLYAQKLAKTLTRIAAEGKRGLYEGPVAADLVATVKGAGGALTLADLSGYRPVQREPLAFEWGGKQVLTMPLPSAGGLLLAEVLALFPPTELAALGEAPAKRIHLLAEAMRGAFADRARFAGDPNFVSLDVARLLSPDRLGKRKALIAEDRTHTQPRFGLEDAGTHHLTIADQDGNWVSLTTTVNNAFGAKLMAEGSGILLNDQLTDFTPPSDVAVFGSTESPNRARAGARPVSSMSPTLVLEDGAPVLALGGSGGLTIAPNVTQVVLNRLVYRMTAEAAVVAPRFAIPAPRTGDTLWLDPTLAERYAGDLRERGELLATKNLQNAVQVVTREGGVYAAASDPRKHGSAVVSNPVISQ